MPKNGRDGGRNGIEGRTKLRLKGLCTCLVVLRGMSDVTPLEHVAELAMCRLRPGHVAHGACETLDALELERRMR